MSEEIKIENGVATPEALNRENFINEDKTIKEIQASMEPALVAWAEEVEQVENLEDLQKMEQDLEPFFKENDIHLRDAKYELPDRIDTFGTEFKRSDLIKNIVSLLNRIEVDFKATLGIYQGIRFWKTVGENAVPFHVFDSTMRLLGQVKYKGERDCLEVLAINDWFSTAHDAYMRDDLWTRYLTTRHQILMKRMDDLQKAQAEADQTQQVNE